MVTTKTNKELAYLHELFVAPDWGERFAGLIDEHLELPKEGQALYLGSGTGSHVIALQERSPDKLKFIGIDENPEALPLAQAKATAVKDNAEFQTGTPEQLSLSGDEFDLVIGDASLVAPQRIHEMLSQMLRVAKPGASVVLTLPTFSSFGEFFSIYWEALHNAGLLDHERDVESLITELPAPFAIEEIAKRAGLDDVNTSTSIEEFEFQSGEQFLAAPLIADFLMQNWMDQLPPESYPRVMEEITRLINEERHEGPFTLSVKATVLTGKKALSH